MKVGCQLIVFGAQVREDPDGVLGQVAAAGYDGIEGGAAAAWIGVAELRKLLQKYGLEYVGLHTPGVSRAAGAIPTISQQPRRRE